MLELSKSENARDRLRALREFCPCKVRKDFEEVWERVFEMTDDPDEAVRYQVLHTLCDGSPHELEEKIIPVLEVMYNDSCEKIRRQARRVLNSYRYVLRKESKFIDSQFLVGEPESGTSCKARALHCDQAWRYLDVSLCILVPLLATSNAHRPTREVDHSNKELFRLWIMRCVPPPPCLTSSSPQAEQGSLIRDLEGGR